jgi:hypothetical protein
MPIGWCYFAGDVICSWSPCCNFPEIDDGASWREGGCCMDCVDQYGLQHFTSWTPGSARDRPPTHTSLHRSSVRRAPVLLLSARLPATNATVLQSLKNTPDNWCSSYKRWTLQGAVWNRNRLHLRLMIFTPVARPVELPVVLASMDIGFVSHQDPWRYFFFPRYLKSEAIP